MNPLKTFGMMLKNRQIKYVIITITLIVFLASSVYWVFNGVIDIIEVTLGNIVGYLSNPVSFISQTFRNLNNKWVSKTRHRYI